MATEPYNEIDYSDISNLIDIPPVKIKKQETMKKKQLPYFAVSGDLQSLIELEMVLILLGYDSGSEEGWNSGRTNLDNWMNEPEYLGCMGHKGCHLLYSQSKTVNCDVFFDVSDVEGIVEYVENYKLGNPAKKKSGR